jgi:pilus assembly protein CpaB
MSVRTILVVILALVCGITAAMGISALVRINPPAASGPAQDTVPVVVAVDDIPPYTTLTADMVKVRDLPKDAVPTGALDKIPDALDRSTLQQVSRGEFLMESKLSQKGTRGVASAIKDGMRAYTILTPSQSASVAGFILPGSKVDVYLTMNTSGAVNDRTGGATTFVLLENVEILAVQQLVVPPSENHVGPHVDSVTFLVTQEQATKLNLAQSRGQLHLTLRNPKDQTEATVRVLTLRELQPDVFRPPVTPKPAEGVTRPKATAKTPHGQIRILRGLNESTVAVEPFAEKRDATNDSKDGNDAKEPSAVPDSESKGT